jgi:hypothetical protein
MPLIYECPSCGKKLKIPDELVGHQVRCSDCASTFVAERPAPPPPPSRAPRGYDDYPQPARRRRMRDDGLEQHRGVLVMCFGIASVALLAVSGGVYVGGAALGPVVLAGPFVTIVGFVLGILAWIWGGVDLHRMKRGYMDPDGHGMTTAGYVCGIIGTILNALSLIISCVAAVAVLAGFAAFSCCFLQAFTQAMNRPQRPPARPPNWRVEAAPLRPADYLPRRIETWTANRG